MERLKQKVASGSSRVFASLQQATGSFQAQQPHSQIQSLSNQQQQQLQAQPNHGEVFQQQHSSCQQNQMMYQNNQHVSPAHQVPLVQHMGVAGGRLDPPSMSHHLVQQQSNQQTIGAGSSILPHPLTGWPAAAEATAHLTEEEKGILLEVFKKEEQFQRDTLK